MLIIKTKYMENYEVIFVILLSILPAIVDIALFLFIAGIIADRVITWFKAVKRWVLLLN